MKLLLTSAGFLNKQVSDTFLQILDKPVEQIHLIFIPTASRTKEELKYAEDSRQELINLGINNMTTLNLDRKMTGNDMKNVDVIYVCGGNTFYLLQKMHESGLDQLLPTYSGVYVGVSAGSIVVGPNIRVAAPWDENDVNLSGTDGIRIVDFAIVPHYQERDQTIVDDLQRRADYDIIRLTDNQAVLAIEGERKIIGQP